MSLFSSKPVDHPYAISSSQVSELPKEQPSIFSRITSTVKQWFTSSTATKEKEEPKISIVEQVEKPTSGEDKKIEETRKKQFLEKETSPDEKIVDDKLESLITDLKQNGYDTMNLLPISDRKLTKSMKYWAGPSPLTRPINDLCDIFESVGFLKEKTDEQKKLKEYVYYATIMFAQVHFNLEDYDFVRLILLLEEMDKQLDLDFDSSIYDLIYDTKTKLIENFINLLTTSHLRHEDYQSYLRHKDYQSFSSNETGEIVSTSRFKQDIKNPLSLIKILISYYQSKYPRKESEKFTKLILFLLNISELDDLKLNYKKVVEKIYSPLIRFIAINNERMFQHAVDSFFKKVVANFKKKDIDFSNYTIQNNLSLVINFLGTLLKTTKSEIIDSKSLEIVDQLISIMNLNIAPINKTEILILITELSGINITEEDRKKYPNLCRAKEKIDSLYEEKVLPRIR